MLNATTALATPTDRTPLMLAIPPTRGAEKVRILQKAFGLSLNDITIAANRSISRSQLSRILNGQRPTPFEKKAIAEDIRDVYGEAKGTGFDAKVMRRIVSLRKTNLEKRREEQELLDLYMAAIGMAE